MSRTSAPRFPWLLTFAAVVLLAILIGLGTWQSRRLVWKEDLIASAEVAAGAPVLPLAEALALDNPEFRQVMATCPGLARAPFVELQSVDQGQMGVRLISACQTQTGKILLVDRGFIQTENAARPVVDPSDTMPVVLKGVLRRVPEPSRMVPRPQDGHFYSRDTSAMAEALAVTGRVAEFTLYAQTRINPEIAGLTPSVPAVSFSNNHLGYALTWFGLAIALIVFYCVLLRRRFKPKDT